VALPGGTPDELFDQAEAWLADRRGSTPRDWGAILPPERADEGRAWQRTLLDAGWAGIHWPEEHGGRGLTMEHTAAWSRACALAQVPPHINMVGCVLTGGSLLAYGTPEQQSVHLPRILDGTRLWCQLFSEPGSGSDLASLSTKAELDGDEWVVNGQKVWCSAGRASDWGILLARTDPDAKPHAGISFFVVDMASAGVECRPLRQMTGSAEFDEVFLTDVRIPADGLLGPLHGGWGVAMSVLTNERGSIGGAGISLGRRLDQLASGIAGGAFDPIQRDRLVTLLSRGRALHWLGQRQGAIATVSGSLAKLGVTELLFDLAVLEADLAGPNAMLQSRETSGLLSAPGGRIAGGTTQVQKNIIGERLLGLPKEPKP
jgi:alkylation response protein AidB-like acyl-CoA dehydrogenase